MCPKILFSAKKGSTFNFLELAIAFAWLLFEAPVALQPPFWDVTVTASVWGDGQAASVPTLVGTPCWMGCSGTSGHRGGSRSGWTLSLGTQLSVLWACVRLYSGGVHVLVQLRKMMQELKQFRDFAFLKVFITFTLDWLG